MAREVNTVWNFCNETSARAVRERNKFLSGYDLQKLTDGFSKCEGVAIGSATTQQVCEAYARCMREGLSVRKAAASCGVCVDTAHRWRLRFLANVQAHQPKAVTGMLEVDETYFQIGGVPLDGCIDKPDMTTQKSRAQFGDQLFKGIGLSAEALAKLPRQSALSA